MERLQPSCGDGVKTRELPVQGVSPAGENPVLAAHLCVFDPHGNMLIQQRRPRHDGAELWDFSAGGCIASDSAGLPFLRREVSSRLGLKAPSGIRFDISVRRPHMLDDYYIMKLDAEAGEIRARSPEILQVRWASLEEVKELLDAGEFIPYEGALIEHLFRVGTV